MLRVIIRQSARGHNTQRVRLFVSSLFSCALLWMLLGCDLPAALVAPQRGETPVLPAASIAFYPSLAWPECAPAVDAPLEKPSDFAPSFPFPEDIKFFRSIALSNRNGVEVVGYTALTVDRSYQFLLGALGKVGYALGYRDAEPGEAEAHFTGHGWAGSFWVRSVFTCPSVSEWVVIVFKQPVE